jgi:hypothetical protein
MRSMRIASGQLNTFLRCEPESAVPPMPSPTLPPLVMLWFAGADLEHRTGDSGMWAERQFSESLARGAILSHQAKVIIVLETGVAIESHGGQRGILPLCSPLVGLAVTRGARPWACLNRSTRRSKASSSATMRFISAATYAGQFVRIAQPFTPGRFSKRTRHWRRVPVTGSARKVIDSR